HAERRDLRLAQRDARDAPEELRVLGIRAGPAALDVADPERVQPAGDPDLVLRREGEAFALRAVSQGRVVQDRVHVALRVFHSLSKKSGPSRERPRCLGAALCSSAERRHAASRPTRDSDGNHHDTFSAGSSSAAPVVAPYSAVLPRITLRWLSPAYAASWNGLMTMSPPDSPLPT